MPPPLLTLVLLTFLIPFSSAASSSVPHQSHLTTHNFHLRNDNESDSYQQYFEVRRPLPFEILTPSCILPVLSYDFGDTIGLPPVDAFYSPPANCSWTNVSLHLSVSSNGSQHDRIAGIWLDGVEILRTSTAEPTPDGVFWTVRKDVTRYTSLLRENVTLSVMLENIVDDVYTGVYKLNLTFFYYDTNSKATSTGAGNFHLSLFPQNKRSTVRKLKENRGTSNSNPGKNLLDLYETPADLIIPISQIGDQGFWFRIASGSDEKSAGIQIPSNTYRAVIEVYVSSHGNDEFWYSNPPDSYIEMNHLTTQRGHGAYRELVVMIDRNVVGSVIPFPVIFTSGINPLFWEPIVSIGAFDLPSYDFDLTPFLGMLLDGKVHSFGVGVADAISFWLVDANLHLWLDDKADAVQAATIKYTAPDMRITRSSQFRLLEGSFEIEGKRKNEFLAWVNSSKGNVTIRIYQKLKFENTIKFKRNGTHKKVKQKVKVKTEYSVLFANGALISRTTVSTKYPLKITTKTSAGVESDTYLMSTDLEQSLSEEKHNGHFSSSLVNSQESSGWMFVQDQDVLSGAATTRQTYTYKDTVGCYTRIASAANGKLKNDTTSVLCTRKFNGESTANI